MNFRDFLKKGEQEQHADPENKYQSNTNEDPENKDPENKDPENKED